MTTIQGSFEVKATAEPPHDIVDGVALGRMFFDKQFSGPLTATSRVEMLSARGTVPSSAGYVAIERSRGSVEGRSGTFVVLHLGLMNRGTPSLDITIVPDSGTGELVGIRGSMRIDIKEGKHFYSLDYELAP